MFPTHPNGHLAPSKLVPPVYDKKPYYKKMGKKVETAKWIYTDRVAMTVSDKLTKRQTMTMSNLQKDSQQDRQRGNYRCEPFS